MDNEFMGSLLKRFIYKKKSQKDLRKRNFYFKESLIKDRNLLSITKMKSIPLLSKNKYNINELKKNKLTLKLPKVIIQANKKNRSSTSNENYSLILNSPSSESRIKNLFKKLQLEKNELRNLSIINPITPMNIHIKNFSFTPFSVSRKTPHGIRPYFNSLSRNLIKKSGLNKNIKSEIVEMKVKERKASKDEKIDHYKNWFNRFSSITRKFKL